VSCVDAQRRTPTYGATSVQITVLDIMIAVCYCKGGLDTHLSIARRKRDHHVFKITLL